MKTNGFFKLICKVKFKEVDIICHKCKSFIPQGIDAHMFFENTFASYIFYCQNCIDETKEEYDEFVNIF